MEGGSREAAAPMPPVSCRGVPCECRDYIAVSGLYHGGGGVMPCIQRLRALPRRVAGV